MHKKLVNFLKELQEEHPDFGYLGELQVNSKNLLGDTPLHVAIRRGDADVAKLLLDNGAEVDASGEWGFTPLHSAASFGWVDIAKMLIERGADIDLKNDDGDTALDIARQGGASSIIKFLKSVKNRY